MCDDDAWCLAVEKKVKILNENSFSSFFSSRSLSFFNSLLTSIIAQLNEWRKTTWNGLETEDESSSSYWSVFFFSVDDLWLPHFIFDNFNTYFICANNISSFLCCLLEQLKLFFGESKQKRRPLSIFVRDSAIFVVKGQTYNREEWGEVLRPSSMSPFWSQISNLKCLKLREKIGRFRQ